MSMWRLKWLATRAFVEGFVWANVKESHSALLALVTGGFPSLKSSNVGNVSMPWRHHAFVLLSLFPARHYDDVIMSTIASQITSLAIVYSIVYSDADQRKHQSSASLAYVWGIHRGPVNSPHKWPVTRKRFPFDDVIMVWGDVGQQMRSYWCYVLFWVILNPWRCIIKRYDAYAVL